MKFIIVVITALAAVGVSAKPQPNAPYQANGFNCCHGGYGSSIPVLHAHLQTSPVENPTVGFPALVPSTSISDAYHCLRTLVRPQLRNEIIAVPSVDRIVRTVTSPVVETFNCGGGTRLTTYATHGMQSAGGGTSEGGPGTAQTMATASYLGGGGVRPTGHNTNGLTGATSGNGATATLLATPTSIFTFHTSAGGNAGGCANPFSGNPAYANTGRINTF